MPLAGTCWKKKNKKMKINISTYFTIRLAILAVVSMSLVGCSGSSNSKGDSSAHAESELITVQHKFGELSVPLNPERTVALDIGAIETMIALGVKPLGIPKKFLPDYLGDMRDDAAIGDVGSVIEPDFEAIVALKPQLIFISVRQERFYEELREIAPTVYIGADTKDYLPSFQRNVELIGRIYGKKELALGKLAALQTKISQARSRYASDENKAMFVIYNNGKFSAFGKGSRFGFIHDVLGIKPVLDFDDESVHGQRISGEFIAEANPDYLFIVDRNAAVLGRVANKQEVENKLVMQTAAYRNGKVFYLDPNVWFISGGGLISVELMVDDILELI